MSTETPATWERVAREVGPGWDVVKFDASTGETTGTVEAPPELIAGLFRVPVRWHVGAGFEEVVEAPMRQRAVRYIDASVLVSSVGIVWLFRRHVTE